MPDSPGSPADHKLARWQFSLRGMLIFTVSVAIGAAVAVTNQNSWLGISPPLDPSQNTPVSNKTGCGGGLLAFLVFWMILGLIYQVRDLRCLLASHHSLSSEQRWGARFEIFWRITITLLIALFVLMAFFIDQGVLKLPEWNNKIVYSINGGTYHEAIFITLLLIVIGSIPHAQRRKHSSFFSCSKQVTYYLVAVVFCFIYGIVITCIHYLTYLTTFGMKYGSSAKFSDIHPEIYNALTSKFFWWAFASTLIVASNWIILKFLSIQWSNGVRRRLLWLLILIMGVASTSIFVVWIYCYALKEMSPYYAAGGIQAPLHCWIDVSLILIILATVKAYRLTIDVDPTPNTLQSKWRKNPNKYYHEWRTLLLLLIINVALYRLDFFGWLKILFSQIWLGVAPPPYQSWTNIAYIFTTPVLCLWLCLILLTFRGVFTQRVDSKHPQIELPGINPARFIAVWFATLAVMISGIPTLVWMSFALWFNPWFRGRWP